MIRSIGRIKERFHAKAFGAAAEMIYQCKLARQE
jgi:hypothetical protein